MRVLRSATVAFATAFSAAAIAGVAHADAPPVGRLPAGHVSTIETARGDLVAVALPARPGGKVWRVARSYDASVVQELREADVGRTVVVVFAARARGTVRIVYALTRGERAKAFEARTFVVVVR
jgi:hypothetical protein